MNAPHESLNAILSAGTKVCFAEIESLLRQAAGR